MSQDPGRLAQLVRAADLHSAGRRFDSSIAHHLNNLPIRFFGWPATVLYGDPCTFDRWRWLRRHLVPGPQRTLDAGCGSGAFTLYAARRGNEAIGLSFDARNNAVAAARARILRIPNARFLLGDLEALDQRTPPLGPFDQILCLETLEHLRDDRRVLAALASRLKPGGRLLLTTPYTHYRRLLGDRLSTMEEGGHVRWGYTHEEIRVLLEACGVDVVREEFISGVMSQQVTNVMRLLSRVNAHLAWLVTLPLRLAQIVDAPVTRWLCYPYLCIGVVGIKRVE